MRTVLPALALLLVASAARAEDDRETVEAKQFYKEGVRLYDLHEYSDALAAFKRAYVKYESPLLFYNIAQCHRALDHRKEAIEFYRMYLNSLPNSPDRPRVEALISDLEKPPEKGDGMSKPTVLPTDPPPPREPPSTPPTDSTPIYKRWWLWTAVAAVVLIGAGVGLAVGLSSSSSGEVYRLHF